MKIDIQLVRKVFEDVLSGHISREEADEWAVSIIKLDETGNVKYTPPSDESKIRDGILFLRGIDLKDSPESYLHDEDDIKIAMIQKLKY